MVKSQEIVNKDFKKGESMTDVNTVDTATTQETQVEETKVEQQVQPEAKPEKAFTQDEVNKIVAERLERERSALAKALGAEQFDKEQIAVAFKTAQEQLEAERQAKLQLEQQLSQKQQETIAYQQGIRADKVDEALTLAKLRAEKDGIELAAALEIVANEYTNLTSVKVRGGIEVGDKTTPKNPYLTEALVRRYPHLAKNKK